MSSSRSHKSHKSSSRSHRSTATRTPVFESSRLETSGISNVPMMRPAGQTMSGTSNMSTRSNISVVKENTDTSGNTVQLVRTIPEECETTEEIVENLFKNYTYNKGGVRAKKEDLDQFNKAFPTHGKKIIDTYDGSNIMTDTNQSLVGESYYAKQIAEIKERNKTSFLKKWDHLLYQGDETYTPSIATPLPHINFHAAPTTSQTFSMSQGNVPTSSRTFSRME